MGRGGEAGVGNMMGKAIHSFLFIRTQFIRTLGSKMANI